MRIALTLLAGSFCLQVLAQPQPMDASEQNRLLGRGVNIIGYDPLWRSREQARFQEKHFRLLKEAGFQSVRVNLHALAQMDETNGWSLRTKWWETLDWAVDTATVQGLQVILDFHEYNRMGEDPENHKAQFLAFWRQLSEHCQKAPSSGTGSEFRNGVGHNYYTGRISGTCCSVPRKLRVQDPSAFIGRAPLSGRNVG